jgi:hypothetical protein
MGSQDKTTHPEWSAGQQARDQLLAAMPLTERQLQLAGVSTTVLEGGDGPPVVLLHGHGEFAAVWIRVVPDLVATTGSLSLTYPAMARRRSQPDHSTPVRS